MMEISRPAATKAGDALKKGTSAARNSSKGPDIIAGLVRGARFQGTVLKREGLFDIIDVAGTALKTRSANSLPAGAVVHLEVLAPGNPLQVRLLSLLDPSRGQAAKFARTLLHIRAELSTLSQVFGRKGGVSAQPGVNLKKVTDHSLFHLLRTLMQGKVAEPGKNQAAAALLQKFGSSSESLLKRIISSISSADHEDILPSGNVTVRITETEPGISASTPSTLTEKEASVKNGAVVQQYDPLVTGKQEADSSREFLPLANKISSQDNGASVRIEPEPGLKDKPPVPEEELSSLREGMVDAAGREPGDAAPGRGALPRARRPFSRFPVDAVTYSSSSGTSQNSGPEVPAGTVSGSGAHDTNESRYVAPDAGHKAGSGDTRPVPDVPVSRSAGAAPGVHADLQEKALSSTPSSAGSKNMVGGDTAGTDNMAAGKTGYDQQQSPEGRAAPDRGSGDAAPGGKFLPHNQKVFPRPPGSLAGNTLSSGTSQNSGPEVPAGTVSGSGAHDTNESRSVAPDAGHKAGSGDTRPVPDVPVSRSAGAAPGVHADLQEKALFSTPSSAGSKNMVTGNTAGMENMSADENAGNQQQVPAAGEETSTVFRKSGLENFVSAREKVVRDPAVTQSETQNAIPPAQGTETIRKSPLITARHQTEASRSSRAGRTETPESGAMQQGSAVDARQTPADHALKFLNALTSHADSVSQYQQQIQDYIHLPFFMIPVLFENGQGHGHWSWWKDDMEGDTGAGNMQHLVFDLELSGLGRINIHLLRENDSISMYAAASDDVLPLLRTSMQELVRNMEKLGFIFSVADIFPVDDADTAEFLAPFKTDRASGNPPLDITA